jgi:Protein of unknown function (DUF1326)
MLKIMGIAVVVFAAVASVSFAAAIPAGGINGNYMEARTADVYTGPCFANGEVGINGKEAVFGWKINNGSWHGVNIAGLGVVGVVRSQHTLGDVHEPVNPMVAVMIVDSRANAEQRLALQSFAKAQAPDLFKTVVQVDYAPINLVVEGGNIHGGGAKLTAGSLATVQTRGMNSGDHVCGNEEIWYPPLNKLEHAMPAYATANSYTGNGLGETWNNHMQRSGFVGTFAVPTE